jgi:hypothetical protein
MNNTMLQIFLPAFMIVFVGTISVWSHIRKNKSVQLTSTHRKIIKTELRMIDLFFKILLLFSGSLAIVYAYFPEYYYLAGPIDWLDIPIVNTIGVLILKISLIWIVLAQFNIEKTIALFNSGVESGSFHKLLSYSQKLILTGMLIMFFGFFVTISSIVAIFIFITATLLFDRIQRIMI